MSKKTIFFDIDGTLIEEETQTIPKSAINSLIKTKENGHNIFINTGRPFCTIPNDLFNLNFDGYICGSGTHIYFKEKFLYEKNIEKIKCFEIIEKLREFKIPAILEGKKSIYIDNDGIFTKGLLEMKAGFEKLELGIIKTWDDPDLSFSKLLVWTNGQSIDNKFWGYIKNEFDYININNDMFEVFQKSHNKATGVKYIQNYLSIDLNDCVVVGDSNNDLSMFEYVPNSILMGTLIFQIKLLSLQKR